MRFWNIYVLVGLLISGCAVGPDYQRPPVDVPAGWRIDYPMAVKVADTAWWENFKDPELNKLIQTALEKNKDLIMASLLVEEYFFKLQASQADFYPQINYNGNESRDKFSLATVSAQGLPLGRKSDRINNNYLATMSVGWELDIWGRIRRSTEAARADLLSTEEGKRAVILTVVSSVVSGYLNLLLQDAHLENTKKAVESRKETLRITELKYKGGSASAYVLAQVRSTYEEAAAKIPAIERLIATQENALSVLLGRNPGPILRGSNLDTLVLPSVPKVIPSELLTRRPDVRQKEQALIAANARIGVATAQYFPTISLVGLAGYSGAGQANFWSGESEIFAIGPQILGPLFSGGRITGQVGQAKAQQQQAQTDFLRTIQTAFQEANDALVSNQKTKEEETVQYRWVSALKDRVRLARRRFDEGYSTYIELSQAERDLYDAETALAQTKASEYSSLVDIYKAMGGGWVE